MARWKGFTISQAQLTEDYVAYCNIAFPPLVLHFFCKKKGSFPQFRNCRTLNWKSIQFKQTKWVKQDRITPNLGNPTFHNKPFQRLMDGSYISTQWSHHCRMFLWCAWWVWSKPGSAPAAGLLRCCRREEKHIRGGKDRVHDIISPGLLRRSPVEGWKTLAHFPIRASQPCPLSPWEPGTQSDWAHTLMDTPGNTIWMLYTS